MAAGWVSPQHGPSRGARRDVVGIRGQPRRSPCDRGARGSLRAAPAGPARLFQVWAQLSHRRSTGARLDLRFVRWRGRGENRRPRGSQDPPSPGALSRHDRAAEGVLREVWTASRDRRPRFSGRGICSHRGSAVIYKKSPEEIAAMRAAGEILTETLTKLEEVLAPGITTGELDRIAEESITGAGATPSFKGYRGFPASICTSPNHVIVHGIPDAATVLGDGDILSVDVGVLYDGYHVDSAWTFPVGEIDASAAEL